MPNCSIGATQKVVSLYHKNNCVPELLSKNPILRRENDLPEKFGQMNTLYFPKFSVKMCCFWTKQLWNCTPTNEYESVVYPIPEWKRRIYRKMKIWQKKLMLWCFIAHDGRKSLQKVCERINSSKLQMLQESLLLFSCFVYFGQKIAEAKALAHILTLSKTWFSGNGIEILVNWPPNSPTSLLKIFWSLLKKGVFRKHPKNIEELWEFCQEEFERIPLKYIQNLYSSIPDRLNKIVQCNGKNIEF